MADTLLDDYQINKLASALAEASSAIDLGGIELSLDTDATAQLREIHEQLRFANELKIIELLFAYNCNSGAVQWATDEIVQHARQLRDANARDRLINDAKEDAK